MSTNHKDLTVELLNYFFGSDWNKNVNSCSKCSNHCRENNETKIDSTVCNKNMKSTCSENNSERGKYLGYKLENIIENDNNNGVKLIYAVPGLTKDDITVSIKDNVISIKGNKDVFYFGSLDAQVRIKFDVYAKNIKCTCENGILTINILREKNILTENIIAID